VEGWCVQANREGQVLRKGKGGDDRRQQGGGMTPGVREKGGG